MRTYVFTTPGNGRAYLTEIDLKQHRSFRIRQRYFSYAQFCRILNKAPRIPFIVERNDDCIEIVFEVF